MEKVTWKTRMTFGKYKGVQILTAWVTNPEYFKWLIENHKDKPEIEFLKTQITDQEKRQFKIEF